MTKQEFENGIGCKVSEKTFDVANGVYMSDRNEYISKDSFYTLWKDEAVRTQMLMDYVADLEAEAAELKKENGALKKENEEMKKENEEMMAEVDEMREGNEALIAEADELREERNEDAHLLIDAARDIDEKMVKFTESPVYKVAVRLIGREAAVMYCLKKHYQLSAEDERWLQEQLTKNK